MNIQKLKTRTLYENLKAQILSRTLSPNTKLPSEAELIEQYGISRYAARKVLEQLVEENLVYKQQGVGCFVCAPPVLPEHSVSSHQILLIASRAEHFYFLKTITGIENALQDSGYTLTIRLSNYNPSIEASLLEEAFQGDYAGYLIFPSESAYIYTNLHLYRYIEKQQIPCIILGNKLPCANLPCIITDDYIGGKIAADYFIRKGHRTFACIMNQEEYSGCMRYAGFLEGLHNANLSARQSSILWFGHKDKDTIFEQRKSELLELASQATAFFCFNDAAAVNLYHLLAQSGYRIPEDISIIGYDDSYLCETNPVPLTALHQDPEASGFAAARNLLRRIKDSNFRCDKVFLPYLTERASVADRNGQL